MAKRYIATARILHNSKQYRPGDELPIKEAAFCKEMLDAGSAELEDDDPEEEGEKKKPKAKSLTAPAGLTGDAQPVTGAEPDLVGRVPSPKARGAAPKPSKKARKSPK